MCIFFAASGTRPPLSRVFRGACAILLAGLLAVGGLPAAAAASPLATPDTHAVAQAFLTQMFGQGDMDGAYERWATSDFIQHNPEMADGIAGHRAFFAAAAREPHGDRNAWVHVTDMRLVDGEFFALMHHAFRAPQDPGRMFFDIWRVRNGRIVEHWDVIQTIPVDRANPNGMGCGGADYASARLLGDTLARPTCGLPDPHVSRAQTLSIINRYTHEISTSDPRDAIVRWFAPDYRQHSPHMADGIQGAIDHLEREYGPTVKVRPSLGTARIIAEGDLVAEHRLVQYPGTKQPSANVDVFRVTNAHISEHWDIKQPVPAVTRSGHPMW
ncbi:MAG TPA: nuclear transport factor 2 family protein [Steroidobacteraceae bacterium]|nr:nuclear transport factor 2 family protein [Steroidobacteraceae bacterium]